MYTCTCIVMLLATSLAGPQLLKNTRVNINLTMNKQNILYLKRRQHPIAITTTKIPAKIGRTISSTSVFPLELDGSFVVLLVLLLSVVISQPRGTMQYTINLLHYYLSNMQNLWDTALISCSPVQVTKSLDYLASRASRPQQFLSEPFGHGAADQVTSQVSKQVKQVLKPRSSRLSGKVAKGHKPILNWTKNFFEKLPN